MMGHVQCRERTAFVVRKHPEFDTYPCMYMYIQHKQVKGRLHTTITDVKRICPFVGSGEVFASSLLLFSEATLCRLLGYQIALQQRDMNNDINHTVDASGVQETNPVRHKNSLCEMIGLSIEYLDITSLRRMSSL